MKRNIQIIIGIMLISIIPCHGQTIQGKIVDEDNSPLVGATVYLLSTTDSTYISSTVTNTDGQFVFDAKFVDGILYISYLGFQDKYLRISQESLQNIQMKQDSKVLNEVVVTADRIINNTRGYSVNPAGTGIEKCSSMQEMLSFLPGLSVRQNKIMLLGNLPIIYVNGIKITSQDELSALIPKRIDKIEVDYISIGEGLAEKGGVLRITTKKIQDGGFSGFARAETKVMPDYGYTMGSPTLVFNASKGKWTINYYAIYNNQRLLEDANYSIYYPDGVYTATLSKTRSCMNNITSRLNISYDLSKRSKLAISEYIGNVDIKNHQNSFIESYNENDYTDKTEIFMQGPESKFSQQTVAKYILSTDNRGSNLDITADYLLQNYCKRQICEENSFFSFDTNTKERTNMFRLIPKYTHNFANGDKLEIGAGYQHIHYHDETEELGNIAYVNVPSAYANYSGRYKRIMYGGGLTVQYNNMEVRTQNVKTTFNDSHLCPQVMLAWMINPQKNRILRLMYQNTINDMPYSVINSFRVYSNPNYYTTGNTSLTTPQRHSMMVGFSINRHWQTEFMCDYVKDPIYYAHGIDEEDGRITWARPENGQYERTLGVMIEANYTPTKWWRTKFQAAAMQVRFATPKETINGQMSGKFWWNNIFNFTSSFGGTLNAYWETSSSFEKYFWKPVGDFNISLWKTFFEDKLRLSLQSTIWAKGRKSKTEGIGYTSYYHNRTKPTSFMFSITWNFSGNKNVHQRIEAESIQHYNKIEEKK